MEPLVVVSAAVVSIYGYRTVMDIIKDMASDGSFEAVQDALKNFLPAVAHARQMVWRATLQKFSCQEDFFTTYKKRQQRNLLFRPHA